MRIIKNRYPITSREFINAINLIQEALEKEKNKFKFEIGGIYRGNTSDGSEVLVRVFSGEILVVYSDMSSSVYYENDYENVDHLIHINDAHEIELEYKLKDKSELLDFYKWW